MNYEKLLDAKISRESIAAWRGSGKKAVGVVCAFVPLEILHALDIMPVRLRATGCDDYSDAEVWMSSFSCSFAKSILQYLLNNTYELDGVIVTDGCMQAVRIYDNWKWICEKAGRNDQFIFELGVPRMRSDTSLKFFKNDLEELIEGLEKLSGNKLSEEKLRHSIELFNQQRQLVRELLDLQKAPKPVVTGAEVLTILLNATDHDVEDFNAMLKAYLEDAKKREPLTGYRARILMIGSSLDTPDYIKTIENKGGLVVADSLCYGTMPYERDIVLSGSALDSVSDYYMKRLICPRMIDNRDELHEFILNRAKEYQADGVIYQKMQNCECWGGENVLLAQELKALGLPELNLEREQKLANMGQLEIRAEAFIEMVEKEV